MILMANETKMPAKAPYGRTGRMEGRKSNLYRGSYLIGVYAPISEGETLLALCAGIGEFSELMGITRHNASQILSLLFAKRTKFLMFAGRLCSVEFIEEDDE